MMFSPVDLFSKIINLVDKRKKKNKECRLSVLKAELVVLVAWLGEEREKRVQ